MRRNRVDLALFNDGKEPSSNHVPNYRNLMTSYLTNKIGVPNQTLMPAGNNRIGIPMEVLHETTHYRHYHHR